MKTYAEFCAGFLKSGVSKLDVAALN